MFQYSQNRACSMGFWRRLRPSGCTLRISRLGADENDEFRTGIINIDVFETYFYSDVKVPRPRALQPQQHFPAPCLQNQCETHCLFCKSNFSLFFIIFAIRSWLPDPCFQHPGYQHLGYQILATRSWLPDPGFQILATRSWLPDLGSQILATTS